MTATLTLSPIAPPCPSWCTKPSDHDADEIALQLLAGYRADELSRVHYSQDFGDLLGNVARSDCDDPQGSWGVILPQTDLGGTPQELAMILRRLAEQALTAAEWLEAQE